jgi:hypothetical protein
MGGNDKLTGPSLKPATNLEDWNTTGKQFAVMPSPAPDCTCASDE